jgi:ABC-type sulfate transport system substrate-binding protein
VGRQVEPETEAPVYGHTPMVVVTRSGNPAGITAFADLARSEPALNLVHADPLTSGAGQWAVFAEYGSALLDGGSPAAAEAQLQATWQNVRLVGASARAAMTLFELGAGDALVTYEQEALLAGERQVPLEIVVPARTIVAEHVAVVVDGNVTPAERPVAEAFIAYLLSDTGQQSLSDFHLRPGPLAGDDLTRMPAAFTVEELGGWQRAYRELIDTLWRTKVEPRLNLEPTPRLLDGGE